MSICRRVKTNLYIIHNQQGVQILYLFGAYEITLNAKVIQHTFDMTKPIHFVISKGESYCAASMPASGLSRLGF